MLGLGDHTSGERRIYKIISDAMIRISSAKEVAIGRAF